MEGGPVGSLHELNFVAMFATVEPSRKALSTRKVILSARLLDISLFSFRILLNYGAVAS